MTLKPMQSLAGTKRVQKIRLDALMETKEAVGKPEEAG